MKDIIPYRLLKDYDGIITKRLNLRCVSVKVGKKWEKEWKKEEGRREMGEKNKNSRRHHQTQSGVKE